MKKQVLKKLVINKETIARLETQELKSVQAAGVSITCWVKESKCMCEN